MTRPVDPASFDYSKVFRVKVLGAEDGQPIKGEFVQFKQRSVPRDKNRKLKDSIEARE